MSLPPAAGALAAVDLGPVVWSSRSLVIIADVTGTIVNANPAVAELSGTLIGTPVAGLVGAGQAAAFRAWLAAIGRTWQTGTWGILPDANELPRDVRIAACRGPGNSLVLIGELVLTTDLSVALLDVNETLVVEHRRLNRERGRLDRETRLDAMTGVANRRAFDSRLAHEMDRTTRGATFAVVMVDIDRFKSVNDQFGHATGDAVLRWLGKRLRDAARRVDFVARYGGEEFVAILPDATATNATVWAERLRLSIRATPPPGLDVVVTASLGVAGWGSGDTGESVVARADRGLYLAKAGGRDRVAMVEGAEQ
jgi:diguanylate cyclase (GGDEF)-like protein